MNESNSTLHKNNWLDLKTYRNLFNEIKRKVLFSNNTCSRKMLTVENEHGGTGHRNTVRGGIT